METALTTTTPKRYDPLAVIAASDKAASTKEQYIRALQGYLDTGNSLTDERALSEYARTLSRSRQAFLRSALRLWMKDTKTAIKGQATPGNVNEVQAAIYRLEALDEAIKAPTQKGTKAHTWLTQAEVRGLLDTCDETHIMGQRDRLLLGLLVAAGLRREEAASLRFEDVKRQPRRGKERTVLAVKGKGAKDRIIPISDNLASAIDGWAKVLDTEEGFVLRSLGMDRHPGDSMTAVAIFQVVRKRGETIGKPALAPHDLRRTYAQIGFEAGVPITQLSRLLGHASVATTQRYLNLDLDLETTASDFVPF